MGIKEKVKKGELDAKSALAMVRQDSHTYGWLKRRISGVHVVSETLPSRKARKYKSKKVLQPS